MDAARAWAGLFFKVIRDFNPIHFKSQTTDYWSKSPDSKVDAVLDTLKSAARYASEITYETQLANTPQDPRVAVATDRKFRGYIERVDGEISNLRGRWKSFPEFYLGVSMATTIFSGVAFVAHLSKFLQP